MTPDLINGLFEIVGSLAIWLNVCALLRDKKVKGVSLKSMIFFISWGSWNLFYYPHLDQFFSLIGGVSLFTANVTWVLLAFKYRKNIENEVSVIALIRSVYEKFDFIPQHTGHKIDDDLYRQRLFFMFEEVHEYAEQVLDLKAPLVNLKRLKRKIYNCSIIENPDFGEQLDALIDTATYAIGTALQQKFPVEKGFQKVAEANSKKQIQYDSNGQKILFKPNGWKAPNLNEIL